jgi:hypothetical protein
MEALKRAGTVVWGGNRGPFAAMTAVSHDVLSRRLTAVYDGSGSFSGGKITTLHYESSVPLLGDRVTTLCYDNSVKLSTVARTTLTYDW